MSTSQQRGKTDASSPSNGEAPPPRQEEGSEKGSMTSRFFSQSLPQYLWHDRVSGLSQEEHEKLFEEKKKNIVSWVEKNGPIISDGTMEMIEDFIRLLDAPSPTRDRAMDHLAFVAAVVEEGKACDI